MVRRTHLLCSYVVPIRHSKFVLQLYFSFTHWSIIWLQNQRDLMTSERREDLHEFRLGRLKHERLKVPRGNHLLEWAFMDQCPVCAPGDWSLYVYLPLWATRSSIFGDWVAVDKWESIYVAIRGIASTWMWIVEGWMVNIGNNSYGITYSRQFKQTVPGFPIMLPGLSVGVKMPSCAMSN